MLKPKTPREKRIAAEARRDEKERIRTRALSHFRNLHTTTRGGGNVDYVHGWNSALAQVAKAFEKPERR